MTFLSRTSSYIRPHNVSAIVGAYADVDPGKGKDRELLQAVIAVFQKTLFSSVRWVEVNERRNIPLEETIRISDTTLDSLSLSFSGEEPFESPIYDGESSFYHDSYFHIEGLPDVGQCLMTRHLKSTRDKAVQTCSQIKEIYQDIYGSSRGFILDHLRENPRLCIGRITDLGKQIGEGTCAIVCSASVDGSEEMVVRFEKNTILADPEQGFLLPTDKSLLRCTDFIKTIQDIAPHPNVMRFEKLLFLKSIQFKPPFKEQAEIFGLGFEKINGQIFQEWLEINSNNPKMVLKLFIDFMRGLEHLEQAGIPHLDLTKTNLMVRYPEKSSDSESGVVIDYLIPRIQPIYPCFFLDARSSFGIILENAVYTTTLSKEGKDLISKLRLNIQTQKLHWHEIIQQLQEISKTFFPENPAEKCTL